MKYEGGKIHKNETGFLTLTTFNENQHLNEQPLYLYVFKYA